jgi:hypothetical protein
MSIEETTETWVRMDLFCDGFGHGSICAGDQLESLSDVAPTAEVARKAILNAAVKARWRFDPKLQRWLCPDCVRSREASEQPEHVGASDSPPSVPRRDRILEELLGASHLL